MPWLTAALVAVTLAHLVVLLVVLRVRGLEGSAAVAGAPDYHHDEGLECVNCGEVNDEDYRFCRRCVSQLPNRVGVGGGASRPDGRRTL